MKTLLPCPFCGVTPDVDNPATFQCDDGGKWGFVVCCCNGPDVRTGYGPVEEWRDDAIDAWNERTPPARNGEGPEWTPFDGSRGEYGVFVEMLLSDGTTQTMNAHDWFFTAFLRGGLAEPFIKAHRIVGNKAPRQEFEEA